MSEVLDPLWLSVKVALSATLLLFAPAALAGLWLSRTRSRAKLLCETLCDLPLVLPPTAVGFALLSLLGRDGLLGKDRLPFDPDILFTWRAAVLASAVMSFPLVVRGTRLAFDRVDGRLERMGASLGYSRYEVARRITLPIAAPGLLASALLGFSRALGEFGATALLAGNIEGETQTLALALYDDIREGRTERARWLLGVSVLVAFLAVIGVSRLQARAARGEGR